MADITLADIVAWEPRLRPLDPGGPAEWEEHEITWTISARTSAPMLPSIRGGELVLLPSRAVNDSGVALPVLLRELAAHGAGGAVLDHAPGQPSPLPVLIAESIPPELESDLNRLLTERRGELYRAGTDLGRLMINVASAGADLAAILAAASNFLDVPAGVLDRRGALLASSGGFDPARAPSRAGGGANHGWRGDWLSARLAGGETLWIGPAPRPKRTLIRLGAERIALSAEAAIQRAADARPRGPARAAALTALLTGGLPDIARAAALLGLPVSDAFRVALVSPEVDSHAIHRVLSGMGTMLEADAIDGAATLVIELRSEPAASPSRSNSGRRRDGGREPMAPPSGWIALSGVSNGVNGLPGAAREARFVASLLGAGLIRAGAARFDSVTDLGPYRLLYRLWGSPELVAFAQDALGELATRDRRGALRRTLLVFLEAGGSHVDAARTLAIHRNTLAYRLRQIAELTGRDPSDPSTWLLFHLALLAASLPPASAGVQPGGRGA